MKQKRYYPGRSSRKALKKKRLKLKKTGRDCRIKYAHFKFPERFGITGKKIVDVLSIVLRDEKVVGVAVKKIDKAIQLTVICKSVIEPKIFYFECDYSENMIYATKAKRKIAEVILNDIANMELKLIKDENASAKPN